MSNNPSKTPTEDKATQEMIENAKQLAEIGKGKGLATLIKEVFTKLGKGDFTEAFASVTAIIAAIVSGKLSDLKADVEQTKGESKDGKTTEEPTESTENPASESDETNEPKTSEEVVAINISEFSKGNLNEAFATHCKYASIESGPTAMTYKPITVQGIPGWNKGDKTDNWDPEKAGNTDEEIAKGNYKVDSIERKGEISTKKVDPATHKKLEQMCLALQHDSRMPLFTGIDVAVDGRKFTIVKEIHCTNRSQTQSKTLGQPHTGTSYIVRS